MMLEVEDKSLWIVNLIYTQLKLPSITAVNTIDESETHKEEQLNSLKNKNDLIYSIHIRFIYVT